MRIPRRWRGKEEAEREKFVDVLLDDIEKNLHNSFSLLPGLIELIWVVRKIFKNLDNR